MADDSGPALDLEVQLVTDQGALPADADFVTWIRAALNGAAEARSGEAAGGAMSLRLVGLEEGAELNFNWRKKSGPTNVLAFPGPRFSAGLPVEYGDLVICLPVVNQEAAEQGKDPGCHLAHLVVHGTLHLLGYTHDDPATAAQMEALEARVLAGLGIPDPYVMQ